MNKYMLAAWAFSLAMWPFLQSAQADPYQQRVITTTTIVGATTGAVIGSANDQTAQGAILGGVFGAVTGVLLAQNHQSYPQTNYRRYRQHTYNSQPWGYRSHHVQHRTYAYRRHEALEHRAAWRYRAHEHYEHSFNRAYRDGYRHGYLKQTPQCR